VDLQRIHPRLTATDRVAEPDVAGAAPNDSHAGFTHSNRDLLLSGTPRRAVSLGEIPCKRKINGVAGSSKLRSVPAFVTPVATHTVVQLPEGDEWLYELKLDGYRALLIKDEKEIFGSDSERKNVTT
jgi:hypothetical protein